MLEFGVKYRENLHVKDIIDEVEERANNIKYSKPDFKRRDHGL